MAPDNHALEFRATRKRSRQRQFIRGFEAAARWNTAGKTRKVDRSVLQEIDNEICCGFAFDIGGQRKNDFRDLFLIGAFQ